MFSKKYCDVEKSHVFRVTQSAVQLRHLSGCDAAVFMLR